MEKIKHIFGLADIANLNHALQTNPDAFDLKLYIKCANTNELQIFKTIAQSALPLKSKPFRVTIYNTWINEEYNAYTLECLKSAIVSFCLRMKCGDFCNRTLAAIRDTIETNPNLTNLDLSSSLCGEKDLGRILRSLSVNNTVRVFKAPRLIETEEGFTDDLQQLFSENKTLEVFILNNSDQVEISEGCGQALASNKALTTLDFCRNNMSSESYVHLANALRQNNTLQTLALGFNNMDGTSVNEIVTSIVSNTSLTELDLSLNDTDRSGFLHLNEVLQHNTTLTSLNLGLNRLEFLENPSRNSLFSRGLGALRHLRLAGCRLESKDISEIGIAMKTNTDMVSLNLNDNKISDENAHIFADMLAHNTTLEELFLSLTTISDSGFLTIAEGVTMNNTLLFLDLSRIHSVTTSATLLGLRKIITLNSSLTGIFCNCHTFTKQELWDVVECLFLNGSLVRFHMDMCLPDPMKAKVDEILSRNRHNKEMKEMTLFDRLLKKVNHFELTKQTFFDN